MDLCSKTGCERRMVARGFCQTHYVYERRHGMPKVQVRGVCTIPECDRLHEAKGLCSMHYQRHLMYGRTSSYHDRTEGQRFWSKVQRGGANDCWPWLAGVRGKGYGAFQSGSKRNRTNRSEDAHRYSYRLHFGPIPDNTQVCHKCDNPPCVNPNHLFLGSVQDNALDMVAKNRWAAGLQRGEFAGTAKLTLAEVESIRTRHSQGERQRDLAIEFGVCQSQVSRIVRRTSWRHGNQKGVVRAGAIYDA